ncbi:ABC transporter substrate-binding protein [Yinghuangia aomiensis]
MSSGRDTSWAQATGLDLVPVVGPGAVMMAFNAAAAPFDDVRARKAVIAALDADQVAKALQAQTADSVVPDASPLASSAPRQGKQDHAKAQALFDELAAAGKPLSFTLSGSQSQLAAFQVIQNQLAAYQNVTFKYEVLDSSAWVDKYSKRTFQALWGCGKAAPISTPGCVASRRAAPRELHRVQGRRRGRRLDAAPQRVHARRPAGRVHAHLQGARRRPAVVDHGAAVRDRRAEEGCAERVGRRLRGRDCAVGAGVQELNSRLVSGHPSKWSPGCPLGALRVTEQDEQRDSWRVRLLDYGIGILIALILTPIIGFGVLLAVLGDVPRLGPALTRGNV